MPEQTSMVGANIRKIRIAKGLPVEEIARLSGLSIGTINGIEDQQISPPLGHIVSLSKALMVSICDIFGDRADSSFCITRNDSREAVSRFSSIGNPGGYSYASLGHQKQNRQMEPFLVTLSPVEGSQPEPNQHAGEEIIFVLTGQVNVTLAGHTDTLSPGDSIYFDSNLPHIVVCNGREPASIVAVIYAEKELHIF